MAKVHRLLLRIPEDSFQAISKGAKLQETSINQFILDQLGEKSKSDFVKFLGLKWEFAQAQEFFGDSLMGLILFGSTVRGQNHDGSDVDILIVLESHSKIERRVYKAWDAFHKAPSNFSFSIVRMPEFEGETSALWKEMALEGKVLWERDFVLTGLLNRLRKNILNQNFKIQYAYGQRYWSK